MTWTVVLAKDAEKQFNNIPVDRQELILKHLRGMREDPFRGDVKPLKGKKWKGRYRKRIGQYRLIFVPRYAERIVEVSAILTRSERTYG